MKTKYFNNNSIVLLCGLLGIFSVMLYFVSPLIGSWWYLSWGSFKGNFDLNINAFGYDGEKQILAPITYLVGSLVLTGSILAIIGGIKRMTILNSASSILMLTGICLFLFIIFNSYELNKSVQKYDLSSMRGSKVFYGNIKNISWGLGIGFYIALIASCIILIIILMNIIKILKKKYKMVKKQKVDFHHPSIDKDKKKIIKPEQLHDKKIPNS